jgi:hypothetical protein
VWRRGLAWASVAPECWGKEHQDREELQAPEEHEESEDALCRSGQSRVEAGISYRIEGRSRDVEAREGCTEGCP